LEGIRVVIKEGAKRTSIKRATTLTQKNPGIVVNKANNCLHESISNHSKQITKTQTLSAPSIMLVKSFLLAASLALGVSAVASPGSARLQALHQRRDDPISSQATQDDLGRPCGLRIAPCREDMECIPNDESCTNMNRCLGTCGFKNKFPDCGGHRPNAPTCSEGFECLDDPREPWGCGQACDKPGICLPGQPRDLPQCGGFAGFSCPSGTFCYDMPDDECENGTTGNDCIGFCM
jgi:hypothetical protein